MRTSSNENASLFLEYLTDEIVLAVSIYLDNSSFSSLLRTSRYLCTLLETSIIWQARVLSIYGKMYTNDWKLLAMKLHRGQGRFRGFTMDAFTNNFDPYPMDLTITDDTATINWTTLNATTRVEAFSLTRDSATKIPTSRRFSELELLTGQNILIPNHYKGFFLGPCMIGIFPNGCFYLVREEAQTEESTGTTVDMLRLDDPAPQFKGILAYDPHRFDPMQLVRLPKPDYLRLELDLTTDPSKLPGLLDLPNRTLPRSSRQISGTLRYQRVEDTGSRTEVVSSCSIVLYFVEDMACDVMILPYGMKDTGPSRVLRPWLLLKDSVLYGWLQADCIIGLLQNQSNETGSFCLEQSVGHAKYVQNMLKEVAATENR